MIFRKSAHKESAKICTITINSEIYFVGTDVAKALGYKNSHTALRNHVEKDDWLKCPVTDNVGRIQQTKVINESGFYSLVLASKISSAKRLTSSNFCERKLPCLLLLK